MAQNLRAWEAEKGTLSMSMEFVRASVHVCSKGDIALVVCLFNSLESYGSSSFAIIIINDHYH